MIDTFADTLVRAISSGIGHGVWAGKTLAEAKWVGFDLKAMKRMGRPTRPAREGSHNDGDFAA